MDLLDNILAQLDRQPFVSNIINNTDNGQNSSNNTHINTTRHGVQNTHQIRSEVKGERTTRNKSPVNNYSSSKDSGHNSVIRTRYYRIIKSLIDLHTND